MDAEWIAALVAMFTVAGGVVSFLLARASFEAKTQETINSATKEFDIRMSALKDKYDAAVDRCHDKQMEISERMLALERKDILTVSDHAPLQETCRKEVFKRINMIEDKVVHSDDKLDNLARCMHKMDVNIAKLLTKFGLEDKPT